MSFLLRRIGGRAAPWSRMTTAIPILALSVLASVQANAAELYLKRSGNIATYYLDLARPTVYNSLNLNGQVDALDFTFTTAAGVTLTNVAGGAGRPPGDPFTYRSRILDADPLDGGLGWSILGQSITPTTFTFGGGPLGGTIDTSGQPNGRLFIANLQFSQPANKFVGTGRFVLYRAGNLVAELIPTPEPAADVLGVCVALAICSACGRASRTSRAAFK